MDKSVARQKIYQSFSPKIREFFSVAEKANSTDDFIKILPQMPYFIYVHIPFCDSICRDCPYSKSMNLKEMENYCDYLIKEIELVGNYNVKNKTKPLAIYFGGGTPSLLPFNTLRKIMEKLKQYFIKDSNPEVTLEANPTSLNLSRLDEYRDAGITRLSIGIQSFYDKVLKEMGRKYTSDEAKNVVIKTADAGWNFNIDLMYGFDSQTPQMFYDDLDYAINSGVSHIATYNLVRKMSQEDKEIEYIKQSEMYYHIREKFKKAGFIQYIINEFARNKDLICKYAHGKVNLPLKEAISFGIGCQGGTKTAHYEKYRDRDLYIKCIEEKIPPLHFLGRKNPDIAYSLLLLDILRGTKMDSATFKMQTGVNPTKLDFIKDLDRYGFINIANKILTKKISVKEDYLFQYNVFFNDIFFNDMKPPADPTVI